MIRLNMLGPIELWDGGGAELRAVIAQPKRFAVLAYLAVASPAFVRRDTLLALFWPELDERRARGALNQAVNFLRRHLNSASASVVVSRGDEEIGVDERALRCDLADFRRAIDAGQHADALDGYRGDLLAGFFAEGAAGFEQWLERERAHLRGLAARAARSLAESQEREGNPSVAVASGRRAVELSSPDERAVRELLALLDRLGDRAGAIDAYDRFARQLGEELDTKPSAQTVELIDRIRSREVVTSPRIFGVLATTVAPTSNAEGSFGPAISKRVSAFVGHRGRVAALGAAALAGIAATYGSGLLVGAPSIDQRTVAVLPFHVTARDSSYLYLREAAMDLFNARLSGDGVPRAIDARAVLSAYKAVVRKTGDDLTANAAVALGRRFGAGLVVTGEIVVVDSTGTMTARILSVPSGKVVAEHSESRVGDAFRLATTVTTRLLAKSVGESSTRLSALSDSAEAVRTYLKGVEAVRAGRSTDAFNNLSRALEIDPSFAAAALWRAHSAWGAFIFGNQPVQMADSVAWSLRHRLSERDNLILVALPSIGPRFPEPSTAVEVAQAWERAARANPDRPDVWEEWANFLIAWGPQAGITSHLEIARMAVDSAIALDSAFVPALSSRARIALIGGDTTALRRAMREWPRADSGDSPSLRWAIARALRDPAAEFWFQRIVFDGVSTPSNLELWPAQRGIGSISEAQRLYEAQGALPTLTPSERGALTMGTFRVAGLRGRVQRAAASADSLPGRGKWLAVLGFALADSAFVPLAATTFRREAATLDTIRAPAQRANALCITELWRVHRGDTTGARRAADEMRKLVKPLGSAPGWGVGNLGVCPGLLEALLDRRPGASWKSPALDRLERVLLGGTMGEMPGNIGYLLAARMRAQQGDTLRALQLIRRRDPMAGNFVQPASWRLEGELALATGDTAGAVRAFTRYLEIRDQPDPGPMESQGRAVRDQLVRLRPRLSQ